jgi:putative transposase
VTQGREPLFGEIVDGIMQLNTFGKIIWSIWSRLPAHFSIRHDEWVIMPNHLHGIILILGGGKGEAFVDSDQDKTMRTRQMLRPCGLQNAPIGTTPGSLGAIIQNFKSISTRKINQTRGMAGVPVWQRDYYERVVRDEVELAQFRLYILENPLRWMEDAEYR